MNTFWNPVDKRKARNELLKCYCFEVIKKQTFENTKFKKMPNTKLIRDGNGNLKIVSKTYYLYHTKPDDYDTETEMDEE